MGGSREVNKYSLNSIIDILICPTIGFVDLLPQFHRIQIHGSLVFRQKVVKLGVKHTDDFATLVAHDGLECLVPQHGNGKSSLVIRVGSQVQLLGSFDVRVQRVRSTVVHWKFLVGCDEPPTVRQ